MKTSRTKCAGRRTKRRGQKKMRGGMSSPSAHGFVQGVVGNVNQQWDNTFIRGSPFGASIQNLAGTQPSVVAGAFPSAGQLNLVQSAGSRRHMGWKHSNSDSDSNTHSESSSHSGGKKRTIRGGYWGKVLSQALVPFSLWFAQNKYGTRKNRGKK